MSPEEFANTCQQLRARGLSEALTDDLWQSGNHAAASNLVAANDADLRVLSDIDQRRRAASERLGREAAREYVRRDILGERGDDDE